MAKLTFVDAADLVDFVPKAMRNCVLGSLMLRFKGPVDAISEVAHTIVVEDTLALVADTFDNVRALVEFATSFRSVKVCSPVLVKHASTRPELISWSKTESNYVRSCESKLTNAVLGTCPLPLKPYGAAHWH